MARRSRTEIAQGLTPAQAHYILGKLLEDRKVSASDVGGYVRRMEQEIRELETRLQELRNSIGGASGSSAGAARKGRPRKGGAASQAEPKARRQRKPITAEQRASRELQGQYMSMIRQVPAERRDEIKSVAKEKGRQAAIDQMRTLINR